MRVQTTTSAPGSRERNREAFLWGMAVALLAALAYANTIGDWIVHDDVYFVPVEQFWSGEPASLFSQGPWHHAGMDKGFYRPLALIVLVFEDWISGGAIWVHHVGNVGAHVLATILVYGLVGSILLRWSEHRAMADHRALTRAAALATAVFAVHPIHTEAVNSMFNRSAILATIGVIGALWLLLSSRRRSPLAWLGAAFLSFLALLAREDALVLPGLAAFLLILLSTEKTLGARLRELRGLLILLVPILVYGILRWHALSAPADADIGSEPSSLLAAVFSGPTAPIGVTLSLLSRPSTFVALAAVALVFLVVFRRTEENASAWLGTAVALLVPLVGYLVLRWNAPIALWANADSTIAPPLGSPPQLRIDTAIASLARLVRLLILPYPLQASAPWQPGYPTPSTTALFALALLPALLVCERYRGRLALLVGLGFALIAILPGTRFLQSGLTERSIYLASVGLSLTLALGLAELPGERTRRVLASALAALCLLAIGQDWLRNEEWRSDVALFESEFRRGERGADSLRLLTIALERAGEDERLLEICDLEVGRHPRPQWNSHQPFLFHCFRAYRKAKRFDEALQAASFAAYRNGEPGMQANLARAYLDLQLAEDAERSFDRAVERAPTPDRKLFWQALSLVELYPGKRRALVAAQRNLAASLALVPKAPDVSMLQHRVRRQIAALPSPDLPGPNQPPKHIDDHFRGLAD